MAAPVRPAEEGVAIRTQPIKMANSAAHLWGEHLLKTLHGGGRVRQEGQLHADTSIDREGQHTRGLLKSHGWEIATELQLEAKSPLDRQLLAGILPWLIDQGLSQQIGPHQQAHL
ncbi:hypothetical protein [Cyanobium sp. Cruz-8D1]|uniref:hypothetical protein n=1 Tax=Cyanobium sp. Cruz-8D1 TaxID=2823711 RepID=UPI0020CC27E1|nr:hypothetical protein [Cyanobium sp. Cruz-8D1]